jgi:hypothetical protein
MSSLRRVLHYEEITVSSTAIAFPAIRGPVVRVIPDNANCRMRRDGTAPTSSVGIELIDGAETVLDASLENTQFIRTTSTDCLLRCEWLSH